MSYMYDIDTKNVKKGYKVFTIFLVVGIIFFVVIAAILVFNKKKQNSLLHIITKDVIIKDLTLNMQNRIKEAIKKTSDLEVNEVNVRIKNIVGSESEE